MDRSKIYKIAIIAVVTAAACLIAAFMNFQQLDVMYSSLFYIPLILTGIWYYRRVVPLTVLFVLYFLVMDFLTPGPELLRIAQLFRGVVLIAGAFLFYFIGRQLEQSRRQLAIEKERYRITLLSIGDGVISTDRSGNVALINDVAGRLTGWEGATAVGRPFREVFRVVNELTGGPGVNPVDQALETGKVVTLANHSVLISKDGRQTPVADSAAPIHDSSGALQGVVMVFRDVTAEKERQDRVEYQSLHDQLTDLGNRRYLELQQNRLERDGVLPVAVIVGDVNGLKLANDALGHEMGDMLLKKTAETLKSVLRGDDIICRFGGDEFVVLLPGMGGDEAAQIVKRLRGAFSDVTVGVVRLSISLGWAVKTGPESFMDVFREAEDRMYSRKLSESVETRRAIIAGMAEDSAPDTARAYRIADLASRAFGLSGRDEEDFKAACTVRDIGRVAIMEAGGEDASPWNTEEDNATAKRHAEVSYRILNTVPDYAGIARYVLAHHERWDGAGYPNGLAGEEIPYLSRIIAVVDYYDSMAAAGGEEPSARDAADAVLRHAGTRFDPDVAHVFVDKVILNNK